MNRWIENDVWSLKLWWFVSKQLWWLSLEHIERLCLSWRMNVSFPTFLIPSFKGCPFCVARQGTRKGCKIYRKLTLTMTMTTKVLKYEKKTRVWKLVIEVLALPPHHILRPLDQPHHLLNRALWVLLINPNEWQMGAQTICSKTILSKPRSGDGYVPSVPPTTGPKSMIGWGRRSVKCYWQNWESHLESCQTITWNTKKLTYCDHQQSVILVSSFQWFFGVFGFLETRNLEILKES